MQQGRMCFCSRGYRRWWRRGSEAIYLRLPIRMVPLFLQSNTPRHLQTIVITGLLSAFIAVIPCCSYISAMSVNFKKEFMLPIFSLVILCEMVILWFLSGGRWWVSEYSLREWDLPRETTRILSLYLLPSSLLYVLASLDPASPLFYINSSLL